MANFSPHRFGFGNVVAGRREAKRDRDAMAAQAEADRRAKEAQDLRDRRAKLVEDTLEQYGQITSAASDAAKTGRVGEDEIGQMRQAGQMVLASTVQTLMQDRAMMISSGLPGDHPAVQNVERMAMSLANQEQVFDTTIQSALSQVEETTTPAQRGREAAAEQLAQRDALAEDAGISVEQANEALGLVPGKPAPTNLELIERQIMALREAGAEEDDPRIVRRLAQISKLTTSSVSGFIVPLLEKMARGEILTDSEQEALTAAQKMSFMEQLMFNAAGLGVFGGAANQSRGVYNAETGEYIQ